MSKSVIDTILEDVETVDNFKFLKEKLEQCKRVNYNCKNCYCYCQCEKSDYLFKCIYDCESIKCPLI